MKNIKRFVQILLLTFCVSCNPDILDYNDPNNYDTQSFFNTPEEIQQSVNAAYSAFFFNGMMSWKWPEIFDALANELNPLPGALANEANIILFWQYQFNSSSDCISGYWKFLYRLILRTNLTIYKGEEYLGKHQDENAVVKQSIGEAYFIRGWAYTQLAFYWGRVPLRTTYDQTGNEDAPRSETVEEVWAVAEADFKKAQTLLPSSWDDSNLGRATSGAATGFLGKLYLYNKQYDKAEAEFAKMTRYSLTPANEWLDMFGETKQNGVESIFEVQLQYYVGSNSEYSIFVDPEQTWSGEVVGRSNAHAQLYGWNDWANWNFPTRRVNDFRYKDENGTDYVDPRAKLTFYGGGIGDDTWCDHCPGGARPYTEPDPNYKKYLNKEYKESEIDCYSSNNVVLMRYADVVLMRAECALKGATPDVAAAIAYINQVRSRIGAFAYTKTYTADQAFELLKRERQLELMGEYHRFNDLKRWNILKETMDAEMAAIGSSPVDPKYNLFPIPQTEIDTNLGLGTVQNGWN